MIGLVLQTPASSIVKVSFLLAVLVIDVGPPSRDLPLTLPADAPGLGAVREVVRSVMWDGSLPGAG